jgi:rod shape-determining protein MreC
VTDRRILVVRTVLLWVLLELVAAAQVRNPGGELVLVSWARNAVSPVLWVAQAVGTLIGDMASGFAGSADLAVANRELSVELEASEALRQIMAEDMTTLLELSSLATDVPKLSDMSVPARLTYRNLAQGRMIALTHSGRRIPKDTPVVASGGVVGRVVHSDGQRSWIEVITHPVAAVAVQTDDGSVQGLSRGSESDELIIEFVARQAELLRGTVMYSSGADGVYPPGLPVSRVTAVRESASAFLEVRARPTADLATARTVLLIAGWATGIEGREIDP